MSLLLPKHFSSWVDIMPLSLTLDSSAEALLAHVRLIPLREQNGKEDTFWLLIHLKIPQEWVQNKEKVNFWWYENKFTFPKPCFNQNWRVEWSCIYQIKKHPVQVKEASQFALKHFWKPREWEEQGTKKSLGDSGNWTEGHYTWSSKNPCLQSKTGPEKQPIDNYSWRRPIKSDNWTPCQPTVKLVHWVSRTHHAHGVFNEPLTLHA